MGNSPISGKAIISYKVEAKEYAQSNRIVNSFVEGAGLD